MKTLWRTLLLIAACATNAWTQSAEPSDAQAREVEVRAYLEACSEAWNDVRTLRVRFTQTKELAILRRPRKSNGSVHVKHGRVLMTVANEGGNVEMQLAVENREARLFYPSLARLEIYALGAEQAAPTPFPLFGNDLRALNTDYRIEMTTLPDEAVELRLEPRAKGSSIKQVLMQLADHRVRRMEQVNVNGDRVVLAIERYEPNVEIKDEDVQLDVPEGTEVVRVLDPRSGRKGD